MKTFERIKSLLGLASKKDLKQLEERMSAISDFVTRVDAHNQRISAGLDGIQADITGLKELIEKLQNSPGPITPEDQRTLDEFEQRLGTLASRVESVDALTPPPAPPPPPQV